ncbi:MAG: hypothetical protein Q9202_006944 [Teloschistes flavicans]
MEFSRTRCHSSDGGTWTRLMGFTFGPNDLQNHASRCGTVGCSSNSSAKANCGLQMIHDLQNRRLSVLSQPEWQSGPWKIHVKNPDQQLYDVGIDLTRIIARTNTTKFINENATFALERAALIEACQNLDTRLENWFQQLNEDIPTPHYWPEFSRMDNTSDECKVDLAFPVSFHFPNIYVAKLLNDYWAISIILHSTIKLLYQSLAGQTRENRPEHPADDQGAKARAILPPGCNVPFRKKVADPKLLKSFASNIAQSMEYFLSKDMGILGPQWALFGLRVALQTYHYGPPSKELRWLQAVHDKISDEKGSEAVSAKPKTILPHFRRENVVHQSTIKGSTSYKERHPTFCSERQIEEEQPLFIMASLLNKLSVQGTKEYSSASDASHVHV